MALWASKCTEGCQPGPGTLVGAQPVGLCCALTLCQTLTRLVTLNARANCCRWLGRPARSKPCAGFAHSLQASPQAGWVVLHTILTAGLAAPHTSHNSNCHAVACCHSCCLVCCSSTRCDAAVGCQMCPPSVTQLKVGTAAKDATIAAAAA